MGAQHEKPTKHMRHNKPNSKEQRPKPTISNIALKRTKHKNMNQKAKTIPIATTVHQQAAYGSPAPPKTHLRVDQQLERQVPKYEAQPGQRQRRSFVRGQRVFGDAANNGGAHSFRRGA